MPFAIGRVVFRAPFSVRSDEVQRVIDDNRVVATLRSTVEHQRQTIVMLERKITDISTQNEEMMKRTTVSPEEVQAYKNSSANIMALQSQLDELAVWLRNNKSVEIGRGEHNHFPGLVQTIIHYLTMTVPKELKPEGTVN